MSESRQELARAKQLIQAKRYEDARALLITIDHPTADKWLDRLSKVPKAAPVGPPPDYTNKAVALFVLYFVLFIPGLLAGDIWSRQAKKDLKRYGDVPGAKTVISLHKFMFWLLMIAVVGMFLLTMGALLFWR